MRDQSALWARSILKGNFGANIRMHVQSFVGFLCFKAFSSLSCMNQKLYRTSIALSIDWKHEQPKNGTERKRYTRKITR